MSLTIQLFVRCLQFVHQSSFQSTLLQWLRNYLEHVLVRQLRDRAHIGIVQESNNDESFI